MKILVRNKLNFEYLKQTGVYTAVFDDAVDFLCAELAFDFLNRHKLKEHEVLAAEDDGSLVAVPIIEEEPPKKQRR